MTDKAEDVIESLQVSMDGGFFTMRQNLIRTAMALIASQAAEIKKLREEIAKDRLVEDRLRTSWREDTASLRDQLQEALLEAGGLRKKLTEALSLQKDLVRYNEPSPMYAENERLRERITAYERESSDHHEFVLAQINSDLRAEIERLRESLPVPRNEYWTQGSKVMTDKAELPDEIWASTLVVTDDDPNMVMGFWGPRRFKDGVRYILADLYDAEIAALREGLPVPPRNEYWAQGEYGHD